MHLHGKYERFTIVNHKEYGVGVVLGYECNVSMQKVCVVAWPDSGKADTIICVHDDELED